MEGWKCPVCNKGNAPFALKCGHCATAASAPLSTPPWPELYEATRHTAVVEVPIPPLRIGDPPGAYGPGVVYVGLVKEA